MLFVLLFVPLLLDKHLEHTSKALTTSDQANIWTPWPSPSPSTSTSTLSTTTICGHGRKVEKSGIWRAETSGGGVGAFRGPFICIYFIAFFFRYWYWYCCCCCHLWNDIETVLCCWFFLPSVSFTLSGGERNSRVRVSYLSTICTPSGSSSWPTVVGGGWGGFPTYRLSAPNSPNRNTHSLIYSPAGRNKSGFLLSLLFIRKPK